MKDVGACVDPNRDYDEAMDNASHSTRSDPAYFYCARAAEEERRKPDEIIRSLLGQLAFKRDNPQELKQQEKKAGRGPPFREIEETKCQRMRITFARTDT